MKTRLGPKLYIALTIVLVLSMVIPWAVFADTADVDADSAGAVTSSVDLTVAPGAAVSTDAYLVIVKGTGSQHLSGGTTVAFSVDDNTTNLPAGYTVGDGRVTTPSGWDTSAYAARSVVHSTSPSSISFMAPSPVVTTTYNYHVAWNDDYSGPALTGNPIFTIHLTVAVPPAPTDTTAPTTMASAKNADNSTYSFGTWTNQSVTVTLTADDGTGSGVKEITYSASGAQTIASTTVAGSSTSFDIATEGVTTVTFHATDNAGNSETTQTKEIKIDKMAPATTASAKNADDSTYTPGTWTNQSVSITLSADDGTGSGVASTEYRLNGGSWTAYGETFTITDEGTTTVDCRSTDVAGNVEDYGTATVKIDKTAPTTTKSLSGTAGSNGWYISSVQVTLSADDGTNGSGVTKTEYSFDTGTTWNTYTGPFSMSDEGTTTVYFRSTDNAGNVETVDSDNQVTIRIDETAPTTGATLSGTAGSHGWYTSAVQVTLSASDNSGGSGVATTEYKIGIAGTWSTYTTPFHVGDEGITAVYFRSTDNAGNTEVARSEEIKIDTVKPTISGAATTDPNANGWYKDDVVIHWTVDDPRPGSGIDEDTCPADSTITGEGDNLRVSASVSDLAGNSNSASVTGIKIDRHGPKITITLSPATGPYLLNQSVTASFTVEDSLSGVDEASVTSTVPNGSNINTSSIGTHTFTVTAKDKAGNEATKSVTYSVIYGLNVLYNVDASHKLGSTIPIKLQLLDANGVNMSSPDVVLNAGKAIKKDSTADGPLASDSGNANPDNNFRYDASLAGYIFNLSTKNLDHGTWLLKFTIGTDPTVYTVEFNIK